MREENIFSSTQKETVSTDSTRSADTWSDDWPTDAAVPEADPSPSEEPNKLPGGGQDFEVPRPRPGSNPGGDKKVVAASEAAVRAATGLRSREEKKLVLEVGRTIRATTDGNGGKVVEWTITKVDHGGAFCDVERKPEGFFAFLKKPIKRTVGLRELEKHN